MGGFSVDLSKVSGSMACLGKIGISPRISGSSRSLAPSRLKRTPRSPTLLDAGDLGVVGLVVGPALVAQDLHREDHVVDGDRRAVGEFGLGVEGELDPGAVGRRLHRLGDQAVEREGLVGAALQQRLEDQPAEHRIGQAARRGEAALDDERIEAVEGADDAVGDLAALGRIRIGVGQVVEVRRQGRIADHGDAVHGLRGGDLRHQPEAERGGDGRGDRALEGDGQDGRGHGQRGLSIGCAAEAASQFGRLSAKPSIFAQRSGPCARDPLTRPKM